MSLLLASLPLLVGQASDVIAPASEIGAWTRFRGPAGTSVLPERHFPAEWGPEKNVAWSVEVPGSGWSSPIVFGDRVFLSAAVAPGNAGPKSMSAGAMDPSTRGAGGKPESLTFELSCLSLEDGERLWRRTVGEKPPAYGVHASNTYATETPATDGERVFVTFGALGELVAFDLEGEELWRVETGVYPTGNNFGWGISLVTHGGLVFLQNDNENTSFLAAFDAGSGEEVWRAERKSGTSWGTPLVLESEGRTSLVACGPDTVTGYDPEDGEVQWQLTGIGGSFSSSPTHDGERVYFGNSGPMSRGPLLAVPVTASGTLDLRGSDPAPISWKASKAGPGFASPVVFDGLVFVLASSNIIACHDAETGERLWRERIEGAVQIVASPWSAGDELHVLDEEGSTFVLAAGPDFEVLRTNELPGLYWGTPSVAGDALLLRESRKLFCIRE